MRSFAVVCAAALALVLAVPPALAAAQTPRDSAERAPYSRLRIRVTGERVVRHEATDDFWRAQTGGGFAVTTPFYLGSVGVGATLIPFRARDAGRPNFRALLLGVDWGADIAHVGALRARVAARLGDFVMLVENPDLWLDSESELFVGGELSAGLPLWRNLAVTVAASFARVHTRPPLDLALLTVGLEYATRTPGWLRAFLE